MSEMDQHVEVQLKSGSTVRVAGDIDGFISQIRDANMRPVLLVRFEEIPNGNDVWLNANEVEALRGGEHPRPNR